jgi:anti-anti-sigma regulatory factor
MASPINLAGEITLQNIEGLHRDLLSAFNQPGPVIFYCRDLVYLDTAAFQLLLAFKKSLAHPSVTFEALPPVILESARLLGLQTLLNMED